MPETPLYFHGRFAVNFTIRQSHRPSAQCPGTMPFVKSLRTSPRAGSANNPHDLPVASAQPGGILGHVVEGRDLDCLSLGVFRHVSSGGRYERETAQVIEKLLPLLAHRPVAPELRERRVARILQERKSPGRER